MIPSSNIPPRAASQRQRAESTPVMVERRIDLGLLERALSVPRGRGPGESFVTRDEGALSLATPPEVTATRHTTSDGERGRSSPVPSYHERPPGHPAPSGANAHRPHRSVNCSTLADSESQSQSPDQSLSQPSLRQVVRSRPLPFIVLIILAIMLVGTIAGWIVFMRIMTKIANQRRDAGEGDGGGVDGLILVGNGGFVLLLLLTIALALRQILFIYALIRPPPPRDASQPTILNIPAWLLPTPPAYSETPVPRATSSLRRATTGVVELESLPVYGQTRGSKLLLRSESRGGSVTSLDHQREVDHEDDEERVGVVVLYHPASARTPVPLPATTAAAMGTGATRTAPDVLVESQRGPRSGLSLGVEVEVEMEEHHLETTAAAEDPGRRPLEAQSRLEGRESAVAEDQSKKSTLCSNSPSEKRR
ncbi:hypothetical protein IAU59_004116 [Kwoniella sp. CBS 9459]